ncbi:hypothetical protein [Vibrio sp. 99-8-1]|uniref:hypothetical protein n=1 Tax=Vibrio sp. 99-8-1 TaxID=2607602 RepID=UPI001493AD88|nr:hypothetical protein [Vibrio sp. 99-8-1]NOI64714.1 hypothetical protein [Vibrio sp. 99-8-1]
MSITLIVTQAYDVDFNETGREIDEQEWQEFVESQDNLRFCLDSIVAENPVTGETIKIATSEGDTEVLINDSWQPFLNYSYGELRMGYIADMENSDNPIRAAVSSVAGYFSAIITHDAGDEILAW